MPRGKRKHRQKEKEVIISDLTPRQEAELVTWPTQEQPRFVCPMCSMWSDVDRLLGAPYELEAAIQRYGGSFPGYVEKHGRMKRAGYMQYFEQGEAERQRLAAQMVPIAEGVLTYLRQLAGDASPPALTQTGAPSYQPPGTTRPELDDFSELLEPGEDEFEDDIEQLQSRPAQKRLESSSRPARKQLQGKPEQKHLGSSNKPSRKRVTGSPAQKRLESPKDDGKQ